MEEERLKDRLQEIEETEEMEETEKTGDAPGEELSIEEIFQQLDTIIERLEDGSLSLEDSFQYYERGMRLVKACSRKVDRAEKRIQVLNEEGKE